MSHQLIGRNPDLKKLRDEGFGVEVRALKYLVVHPVPYVNSRREIAIGTLVCELQIEGNELRPPSDHTLHFAGEYPCDVNGQPLTKISNSSGRQELTTGLFVDHRFSAKPVGREPYKNYHEKITTYVAKITGEAQRLDPSVKAQTFPVIEAKEEESPFRYIDTASSRAEIDAIASKLARGKIAIVGLGGTGSYVLDLVSKTPVNEIHIFDGDRFSQHNAFRSPGAPSLEELSEGPMKAAFWAKKYSEIRYRLLGHEYFIDESNVSELAEMDFVFVCVDDGQARQLIATALQGTGTPFIDVGMGLVAKETKLLGLTRVTVVTKDKGDHMWRLPFHQSITNEYIRNIQINDLNALTATLAVIKWKKMWGFYGEIEAAHAITYSVAGNVIANEEVA